MEMIAARRNAPHDGTMFSAGPAPHAQTWVMASDSPRMLSPNERSRGRSRIPPTASVAAVISPSARRCCGPRYPLVIAQLRNNPTAASALMVARTSVPYRPISDSKSTSAGIQLPDRLTSGHGSGVLRRGCGCPSGMVAGGRSGVGRPARICESSSVSARTVDSSDATLRSRASTGPRSESATSLYQRKNGVARRKLGVLVRDFHVPRHDALRDARAESLQRRLLRRLLLAGELHLNRVTRVHRLDEAKVLEAVVGQHGSWRRIHEQSRGGGQHEVSVRHFLLEDRLRAAVVLVRVEVIAAEIREAGDVLVRDRALLRDERLADLELVEILPERMYAGLRALGAGHELVEHTGQRRRRALHGGALHVVQHAAHAAQLLPAAGAPRTSVHEMAEWRPMARGFPGAVPVHEEHAPMKGRRAKHHLPRRVVTGREDGTDERAAPALRELHGLLDGSVGHHGVDWSEGLDVVRRRLLERLIVVEEKHRE